MNWVTRTSYWIIDFYTALFGMFALVYVGLIPPALAVSDALRWLGLWHGLPEHAEDRLWNMMFFALLFLIVARMKSDVAEIKARRGS